MGVEPTKDTVNAPQTGLKPARPTGAQSLPCSPNELSINHHAPQSKSWILYVDTAYASFSPAA